MKQILPWLTLVLMSTGALTLTSAHAAEPQRVRVTTDMGAFVIELNPTRAPLTVANFLRYVDEGFYTNTLFHRVVGSFLVQGGGYSAKDNTPKRTRDAIPNESGNGLRNLRATVAMARGDGPHTGTSQFFINLTDNSELDPLPTRWGYAVFGRVVEGMEVLERIGVIPTGSVKPFKADAPLTPVVIEKIERLGAASAVKEGNAAGSTPSPAASSPEEAPEEPQGRAEDTAETAAESAAE